MLVTVTSPMLYRRYKTMDWDALLSSQNSPEPQAFSRPQPSAGFSKLRHNLGAQRHPSLAPTDLTKNRRKTSCRPRNIQLTIKPPIRLARQCGITTVMTKGCWGYCSSYSQPDPRNTTNILHKCSCCQPTHFVESTATLRCVEGRSIRVPVRQVLGCYCRPCYSEGPSRDVVTVRDLLRKAAAHG
ncbi:Bursicon subunit alpha-related polypeptide [Plakobranchus ocellatus]|uniref:Bursicon subunit alpha-related polypeptide n=1 Tax=Plakobranchus ocellatus TaxID=259542 RepID=A0AAV4B580_9GAST|nr:Bursicon subunit alpha-related polypeptide [Plakobranchus ocellatus]